jgi:nitrous oxidase accessory protein NosD
VYRDRTCGSQCDSVQTDGAEIEDNTVTDACYGAFFDPGVEDVRFRNNKLARAQAACAPFGASGIILDGAVGARVENNYVEGWKTDDPKTAGIVVADDPCDGKTSSLACLAIGGPAIARDNRVRGNTLRDNTLDIFVNTTGTGNEFRRNDCGTSNLGGVCWST